MLCRVESLLIALMIRRLQIMAPSNNRSVINCSKHTLSLSCTHTCTLTWGPVCYEPDQAVCSNQCNGPVSLGDTGERICCLENPHGHSKPLLKAMRWTIRCMCVCVCVSCTFLCVLMRFSLCIFFSSHGIMLSHSQFFRCTACVNVSFLIVKSSLLYSESTLVCLRCHRDANLLLILLSQCW